jgi:hypothetical protein
MPAVAGMGPLTADPSAAPTVLVCRCARTTAWEHARTPVAGMAPRTGVLRQRSADCAAAPACSHDGMGACLHANHCWNGIPLLAGPPSCAKPPC